MHHHCSCIDPYWPDPAIITQVKLLSKAVRALSVSRGQVPLYDSLTSLLPPRQTPCIPAGLHSTWTVPFLLIFRPNPAPNEINVQTHMGEEQENFISNFLLCLLCAALLPSSRPGGGGENASPSCCCCGLPHLFPTESGA